jgi:flagellar basal-body rod modification protein FlgD
MSVSQIPAGLEAVLSQSTTETQKEEDPLGRDAFLKMLLAQLENQDPLNPMEGADFSAQLAQFSSLEQLFNVNDNLETISTSLVSDTANNVIDYIGKEVVCENDTLTLSEGLMSGGVFSLDESADLMIGIYDDLGREVITLYPGQLEAGTHQVDWNGYDRTGVRVEDGTYRFELTAIGQNGIYEPITAGVSGMVTGVTYRNGIPYLEVDGKMIDPTTVIRIRQQDGSA